jgi:hypothetical protein
MAETEDVSGEQAGKGEETYGSRAAGGQGLLDIAPPRSLAIPRRR